MVQFHALALLRGIKRHDRLAVSKVVSTLMKSGMRSPLGLCLLMRYALSLHAADAAIIPTPVRQALLALALWLWLCGGGLSVAVGRWRRLE
jgi:hypothetical protein